MISPDAVQQYTMPQQLTTMTAPLTNVRRTSQKVGPPNLSTRSTMSDRPLTGNNTGKIQYSFKCFDFLLQCSNSEDLPERLTIGPLFITLFIDTRTNT